MEKAKKIKIVLGLFYLVVVFAFLYFFMSKFTLTEIMSFEFIKNNRDFFYQLKQNNIFLLIIVFFICIIFWTLMAGFGSPVALLGGFIFGKWSGTLIVVTGMSIGATILYLFGNYFFKDLIKEKFSYKYRKLEIKFKKSEFLYLLAYRFIGGIPFAISNVLPCIFNVKTINFFIATFIGIIPQIFLVVSIGSGLDKIIKKNLNAPKFTDLILVPEIYIPLLGFCLLILITLVLKKIFFKNDY
jgi:uncharacterized membrane protein YdjX (TVP38/TMEM64 family)